MAADARIQLHRDGNLEWFLSVRYAFDMTTGAISCNQEAYIDRFLRKYGLDVAHESWYGSRSFAFAGETKQALRAGIFCIFDIRFIE